MRTSPQRRFLRNLARSRPMMGRGLTLVELLIGMSILAVGLLGIAPMFSTGYLETDNEAVSELMDSFLRSRLGAGRLAGEWNSELDAR